MDFKRVLPILEHYGDDKQKLKALEELTELQEVILKNINKGVEVGIVDEIADVYIMLKQLELIYNVDPFTVREMIDYKLDRQLKRIERESEVLNAEG